MPKFFRNNGLSLALAAVFLFTMVGQTLTGWSEHNEEQQKHRDAQVGLREYLKSGHFWEATAENWESEFLQMAMFVVLTVFLYQKGSAESKDPDEENDPLDSDPRLSRHDPDAPWPVRRGGWVLWLYSNSLSIAFVILFLASFAIHAAGGAEEYNEERRQHQGAAATAVSAWQYMTTSRFWFESFQNWQSEFLSLWAMVVFTIFLRQHGSKESKPVAAPHSDTGDEQPAKVPVRVPVDSRGEPVAQPT
jgi:hypothetical protein